MVLPASRTHFYDWIPAFAGMTAYWIIWVKMKLGIDRKQSGKYTDAVHWMEGGYAESV